MALCIALGDMQVEWHAARSTQDPQRIVQPEARRKTQSGRYVSTPLHVHTRSTPQEKRTNKQKNRTLKTSWPPWWWSQSCPSWPWRCRPPPHRRQPPLTRPPQRRHPQQQTRRPPLHRRPQRRPQPHQPRQRPLHAHYHRRHVSPAASQRDAPNRRAIHANNARTRHRNSCKGTTEAHQQGTGSPSAWARRTAPASGP